MIDLIVLFTTHFLSDIVLQSRVMGKEKSKDFGWMLAHAGVISIMFFIAGLFIFKDTILSGENAMLLGAGIALIHCMQDWFVWVMYRCHVKVQIINKLRHYSSRHSIDYEMKQWKCLKDYWFFFTIGIDQYLHYILIVVIWGMFIQGG